MSKRMDEGTSSFSQLLALLSGKLIIYGLWFSDWSSPAFQQLSGVTQTCATKSLGMVWKNKREYLEGDRTLILGWHLKIYQAYSHPLWGDSRVGFDPYLWALQGCPVLDSSHSFSENRSNLYWVSLHLSASNFLPGVRVFPFPL